MVYMQDQDLSGKQKDRAGWTLCILYTCTHCIAQSTPWTFLSVFPPFVEPPKSTLVSRSTKGSTAS